MKLDDLHKKNIYKVPDEYFDDLPGRIQKRIHAETDHQKLIVFSWPVLFRYVMPVAAVVLILLFVVRPISDTSETISYEQLLNEVPSDEMISFLELEGITSDEILESFDIGNWESGMEGSYLEIEGTIDDTLYDAILDEYDLDIENI